jgi:hypothetical protein
MQKAGFQVQVNETGNHAARARLGMPEQQASCHTAKVGGYVIEGHVPAADIERLLKEKPKALGLAAPGMPVGSPGMDDAVYANLPVKYDVLLVRADGSTSVYATYRR